MKVTAPWKFSRHNWIKALAAWFEFVSYPALGRRQDERPPEVSSCLSDSVIPAFSEDTFPYGTGTYQYSLWATEVSTFAWTHCNDYPRVERKVVFLYRQHEDRRKLYPHHLHLYFRYAPQMQFKIRRGACDLYIILTKIGASRRWSKHLFWNHITMINVTSVSRLWMSLIRMYIQIQTQLFDSFHTTSSYIWTLLFWSATGAQM